MRGLKAVQKLAQLAMEGDPILGFSIFRETKGFAIQQKEFRQGQLGKTGQQTRHSRINMHSVQEVQRQR